MKLYNRIRSTLCLIKKTETKEEKFGYSFVNINHAHTILFQTMADQSNAMEVEWNGDPRIIRLLNLMDDLGYKNIVTMLHGYENSF